MDKAFFLGGGDIPLSSQYFCPPSFVFLVHWKNFHYKTIVASPPPNFVPKRTREFCIEKHAH